MTWAAATSSWEHQGTPGSINHVPQIILEKQAPRTVSGGCSRAAVCCSAGREALPGRAGSSLWLGRTPSKGAGCWRAWPGVSRAPVLLLVGGDPSQGDATKPAFLTPNWQAQQAVLGWQSFSL